MQDKVNSLLSLHQFNLSMDGLLPQTDTLCILRYEPDEKDLEHEGGVGQGDEEQARGNGDENMKMEKSQSVYKLLVLLAASIANPLSPEFQL